MKSIGVGLVTLALVFSLSGQIRSNGGPAAGLAAPDFTLSTKNGTGNIQLSKLQGKPTVLIFASYT
ncbi:MAG: hypothetical protein HY646_20770 [Acidobacteria bacterium]|nr:hypothetical protein [Acidobacteriota bacterium]